METFGKPLKRWVMNPRCRYKKSANDNFEWYYDYETLRDVFSDAFDKSARISSPKAGAA